MAFAGKSLAPVPMADGRECRCRACRISIARSNDKLMYTSDPQLSLPAHFVTLPTAQLKESRINC